MVSLFFRFGFFCGLCFAWFSFFARREYGRRSKENKRHLPRLLPGLLRLGRFSPSSSHRQRRSHRGSCLPSSRVASAPPCPFPSGGTAHSPRVILYSFRDDIILTNIIPLAQEHFVQSNCKHTQEEKSLLQIKPVCPLGRDPGNVVAHASSLAGATWYSAALKGSPEDQSFPRVAKGLDVQSMNTFY